MSGVALLKSSTSWCSVRDWSEWVINPAMTMTAGSGLYGVISNAIDPDGNEIFFSSVCIITTGVLVLARYKIRQLWIDKSIDEEVGAFGNTNTQLAGQVQELDKLGEKEGDEVSALRKQVEQYQGENARLLSEREALQRENLDLGKVVDELRQVNQQLQETSEAIGDDAVAIQVHAEEEKDKADEETSDIEALTKRLAQLDQQRQEETTRHEHAMKAPSS